MTTRAATAAHHGVAVDHRGQTYLGHLKLGVWVFLASECIVFGSLIGTYLALYGRSTSGPLPKDVFDLPVTSLATFVLLASSFTMVMAIAAIRRGSIGATRAWLALTILLGLGFLGFQANEYATFVHEGLKLNTNVFGATFYTLTGLHGTHVAAGVIWLIAVLVNSLRGRLSQANGETVEIAGLYWHFVDMAWMVIFPVVYLLEFAR